MADKDSAAARMIATLPGFSSYVNVKCTPVVKNWPPARQMYTQESGSFLPGEVKRLMMSPAVEKLLRSGHFEVTTEQPNSDTIWETLPERVEKFDAHSDTKEEPKDVVGGEKADA